MTWRDIVAKKRELLAKSIPEEWRNPNLRNEMISDGYVNTSAYLDSILPDKENIITKKTIIELSKLISAGKLSSVEVTTAFAHRAILAHQILNCCSEIFIDRALERASQLDNYFQTTRKTVGILHGIPISLKDQVDLVDIPSSIGYVSRAFERKTQNSLLAEKLLELGAIFYVKTCVPMAMMAAETESNLYPYTYNALNLNLSSGGSSGGEGALIAAGGSRIGFGTDIGGSIRIPAAYNGIYGLKPSVGRISYLRVTNSYEAQEAVPSVIGPLAKTLKEIEFIMKTIIDTQCWIEDPKVLQLEWKKVDFGNKKIKIGVWFDSGDVEPLPPITRKLNDIYNNLLQSDIFEVIKVEWPEHKRLMNALFKVYGADVGEEIINECTKSGENIHQLLDHLIAPKLKRNALSITEWWELCKEVYLIKQNYLKFWKNSRLDAIIAPVMASTSIVPYSKICLDYTGVCNLCDCSSVVLPFGIADASTDKLSSKNARSELEEKIRGQYDPIVFDKMPVCLQVITRKSEEEKGLAISQLLQGNDA